MSSEDTSPFTRDKHEIEYKILNQLDPAPRKIAVPLAPDELKNLADDGYLLKENVFDHDALQSMRDALDRIEASEFTAKGPGEGLSTNREFGGLFLRYLMDKDEVFLKFLEYQPFLSVARAMMGPQLQMGLSARISYPTMANQETHWHQHLRYIPKPLPPWFIHPHCLDVLVYLDDANDANGPLCVVPGSHNRLDEETPARFFEDLPGQVTLRPAAGSAVFMHANTWHRAMPTTPEGTKRRLLLFAYYPTWLKRSHYGIQPADGLTHALAQKGDPETLELLGKIGFM